MVTGTDYEVVMGNWVTARCKKRVKDTGKPMPPYVVHWLETGGNSPPDESTEPPPRVLGWLVKTIDRPAWDVDD